MCHWGKNKGVDVYLEVRKRRGHIFFECGLDDYVYILEGNSI
jgi:hypothetical protein